MVRVILGAALSCPNVYVCVAMARTRRARGGARVCGWVKVDLSWGGVGGGDYGLVFMEELNCPLSVSHGSTLPGRPALTMAWWERSRAEWEGFRGVAGWRLGEGVLGERGRGRGRTRGGDISRETGDKCWRLAQAYLVRGVVPPRFIC